MLRSSSTIATATTSVGVYHTQRLLCSHTLPTNYRFSHSFRNPLLSNSAFVKWKRNIGSSNNNNRFRMATQALAQPLQNADELIDSVETFIFDCDGMFYDE
jgi:phosphoglycolate phosphatase